MFENGVFKLKFSDQKLLTTLTLELRTLRSNIFALTKHFSYKSPIIRD